MIIIFVATICFFLLGFCVTFIPQNFNLLWICLIDLFAFIPAIVAGIYCGGKIQNIW
jgi:ABC-type lipoprotein release transport system permease subunit